VKYRLTMRSECRSICSRCRRKAPDRLPHMGLPRMVHKPHRRDVHDTAQRGQHFAVNRTPRVLRQSSLDGAAGDLMAELQVFAGIGQQSGRNRFADVEPSLRSEQGN
jgi:hypothetical protein